VLLPSASAFLRLERAHRIAASDGPADAAPDRRQTAQPFPVAAGRDATCDLRRSRFACLQQDLRQLAFVLDALLVREIPGKTLRHTPSVMPCRVSCKRVSACYLSTLIV
jgi:hypothetical protein